MALGSPRLSKMARERVARLARAAWQRAPERAVEDVARRLCREVTGVSPAGTPERASGDVQQAYFETLAVVAAERASWAERQVVEGLRRAVRDLGALVGGGR
jgi:hypothetical protein